MKSCVLFYFSGTGNTWWLTGALADLLRARGINVSCTSIEAVDTSMADREIERSDLVGFGYPVYGSDVPLLMQEFIQSLAPSQGKPALIYCSQWLWSGDGAWACAPFVTGRGFNIRWAEHFFAPNNVSMYRWLPFTNKTAAIAKSLDRSRRRMCRLADLIDANRPFCRGSSVLAAFLGRWQRVPFRRAFPGYRNCMQVDHNRCIDCGRCVRICPTGNHWSKAGIYQSRGTCMLCLRCYNFCPVSAITFKGRQFPRKAATPYRGPGGFRPEVLL